MGFAGALAALGLPRRVLLPALLGFNLGIELGPLPIVLGSCRPRSPAAGPLYPRLAIQLGSLAIGALGGVWFMSRAFDLGPGG